MALTDDSAVKEDILTVAKRLAKGNVETEPSIQEIYFSPDRKQIRLVVVDETATPSDFVEPYFFGAAPRVGLPYPSAIALVRPEELRKIPLPEKWGNWDQAFRIWPEGEA